jgi:hypothetical protein
MPQSRVALFLSVDIIMTMLTLGLVVLRIAYRWQKRRLATSDYLICAAMVFSMVSKLCRAKRLTLGQTASFIHMVLDIVSKLLSLNIFSIPGI